MKWIVQTTYMLMAVAMCTTLFFVGALKPASAGAWVFLSVWLTLPYVVIGITLLVLQRKGIATFHWYIVAILVAIGGILFLADVIFWHRDAQGAIAVFMTPLLQGAALAILLPIAWWLSQSARS